jgi:hypothetical protein
MLRRYFLLYMTMTNTDYGQLLAKRSTDLNQRLEELKKLEAYAVCAKDTLAYMQKFISTQSTELNNMLATEKITKEAHHISHDVLNNVARSLKSIEEESLKNYYVNLGIAEFIKQDMTDIVNSRALAQEAEQETLTSESALEQQD